MMHDGAALAAGMAQRCRPVPQQMVHVSPDMMVSRDTSAAWTAVSRGFAGFPPRRGGFRPPANVPRCAIGEPRQIGGPALRRPRCIQGRPAL